MAAKGKEYELAIRISGVVDKNFNTSLIAASTRLGSFKAAVSAMESDFSKLDKGFDKIVSIGKKTAAAVATAATVASVAVGAATAAAITVGSEFESAFAGVKKTVDATEKEYDGLKESIMSMTREIPSSAAEIARVMEVAGQLGISKDSLSDFTETMINLGVSTTMSAEDAAMALARLANITKMDDYDSSGVSNFERLGSVVTALGNNFATTEEEIVTMATRLASTGDLVGLTQAQILALSAAMSSAGIKEETGGSTMSKILKKMQVAVETGNQSLDKFAGVAGMSGEAFSKAFKEDAVVALSAFVDGLDDVERNGKSAIMVLEDMNLKEIRLSNTLLALAGSSENMMDAIRTANSAWDENTALAIEASKRYETMESRVVIMQNALKELGISAYKDLREPFSDAVNGVTGYLQRLHKSEFNSGRFGKMIRGLNTQLPTLQRNAYTVWRTIKPFFDGLVGIGKWSIENAHLVIGSLSGIAAAMIAFKSASTAVHTINAIMSLFSMNPATLGIMGAVATIGTLVGIMKGIEAYEEKLGKKSLEEHFGRIALSMEDVQEVAERIVSSKSLLSVQKALESFGELKGIHNAIEETVSEIDKMNWKVAIGMELEPGEQESYKRAIAEYVENVQEYALSAQYAVSISLSGAFSEDSEIGQTVVPKVQQFYQDQYTTLTGLGSDLNKAITDAFNDGLLEIEEVDKITSIQQQMASIQKSIAAGEFDAKLSLLGMKYTGGEALTAESFQNLQAELGEQIKLAEEAFNEAYVKNHASIQEAFNAGYLSESEFSKSEKVLMENHLKELGEMEMKSIRFQIDTIKTFYGEELDGLYDSINEASKEYLDKDYHWEWEDAPVPMFDWVVQEAINRSDVSASTQEAMEDLMTQMQPSVESMERLKEQYAAAGVELSEEMKKAFEEVDLLQAASNLRGNRESQGAMGDMIKRFMVKNEEFEKTLEVLKEYGWEFPEKLAEGMEGSKMATLDPAISGMYAWSQGKIDEYFAAGFKTEAKVDVRLNPNFKVAPVQLPRIIGNKLTPFTPIIPNQRANGGLATRPELTWFAEKGPEMAIPIDGSKNAISLWEKTGRLLGMGGALDDLTIDGGASAAIEYKPTLQFYGEAPKKEDLQNALKVSQDEFEQLMNKYLKTHGRVSFT